jgi:hypothetical protein
LPHILGWARLPNFVFRLYEAVMLSRSLAPGFPVDSASHACHCMLTMWLLEAGENLRQETLSLGQEAAAETEEQTQVRRCFSRPACARRVPADSLTRRPVHLCVTQEKAFVLRPLVFSPQYSLFVAPWNIRTLPQIGCDVNRGGQVRHLGQRTAAVSSTDNTLAQPVPLHVIRRLGREWEMKPPCVFVAHLPAAFCVSTVTNRPYLIALTFAGSSAGPRSLACSTRSTWIRVFSLFLLGLVVFNELTRVCPPPPARSEA